MIPVCCFTCGKVIHNDIYVKFRELVKKNQNPITTDPEISYKKFFEDNNVIRYCCRTIIMSSIDMSDAVQKNSSDR